MSHKTFQDIKHSHFSPNAFEVITVNALYKLLSYLLTSFQHISRLDLKQLTDVASTTVM